MMNSAFCPEGNWPEESGVPVEDWSAGDCSSEENRSKEDETYYSSEGTDKCQDKEKSLISQKDIKYKIEDIATKLQVEENVISSCYDEAEIQSRRYLQELEQYREGFEDRPKHMLHVLEEVTNWREKLEPDVEHIQRQLHDFEVQSEKYTDVAERSDSILKQLERYKKICELNCEDIQIDKRFGYDSNQNTIEDNDKTCISLQVLQEYITAQLVEFRDIAKSYIRIEIENSNESYAQKLEDLKNNLKEAAVKQFGMLMYDVLSLQDDYYHYSEALKNVNISSEIENIEENIAEIRLMLVGLKRDLEKYRQYCMNCNTKERVKRNINRVLWRHDSFSTEYSGNFDSDYNFQSNSYPNYSTGDNEYSIVDVLISAKISEISENISDKFAILIEELDKAFSDPKLIDSYIAKLQPIQEEIRGYIQEEQEAFLKLKNNIPESSLVEVSEISQKSKQIILSLQEAKEYIDIFISH